MACSVDTSVCENSVWIDVNPLAVSHFRHIATTRMDAQAPSSGVRAT